MKLQWRYCFTGFCHQKWIRYCLYLSILVYLIVDYVMQSYGAKVGDLFAKLNKIEIRIYPNEDYRDFYPHSLFKIRKSDKNDAILRFVGVRPCSLLEPNQLIVRLINRSSVNSIPDQSKNFQSEILLKNANYVKMGESCPLIFSKCKWTPYYVDFDYKSVNSHTINVLQSVLPIINVDSNPLDRHKHNLVQCGKTMLFFCNWLSFLRFIEYSLRITKVEHFFVYQTIVSNPVQHVSDLYEKFKLLEIIPWILWPRSRVDNEDIMSQLVFHGQLVTAQECFVRATAKSNFASFFDYDEFAVLDHNLDTYFEPSLKFTSIGAIKFMGQQTSAADLRLMLRKNKQLKIAHLTNHTINFDIQYKFIVRLASVTRLTVHSVYSFTNLRTKMKFLPQEVGRVLHVRYSSQGNETSTKVDPDYLWELVGDPERLAAIKKFYYEHGLSTQEMGYGEHCAKAGKQYDGTIALRSNNGKCPSIGLDDVQLILNSTERFIDWKMYTEG